MSFANFIPEVWSAQILENLRNDLIYASPRVVNRDYEGEIAQAGDTVRINSVGPVTVFDYTRDSDMPVPQTLSDAQQVLLIDQAKGFNFLIDDIDLAQQRPRVMNNAMQESAYALANTQDTFVAALHSQAGTANLLGTTAAPITITSGATTGTLTGALSGTVNAYDLLTVLATRLSVTNTPVSGRYVTVPPWFHGILLRDTRFTGYGTDGNLATLRNGAVGMAAGLEILVSNNVPNTSGTAHKLMAGHPFAITIADQIVQLEAYRPERRFADAIKGLHVYGAKVIRPSNLIVATCNEGT